MLGPNSGWLSAFGKALKHAYAAKDSFLKAPRCRRIVQRNAGADLFKVPQRAVAEDDLRHR
jgi:hypothetical protein